MNEGEYENLRRVVYGDGEYEGATFIPVCDQCGRFVKPDSSIRFGHETILDEPNATCAKCGRTKMLFEGFI